MILIGKKMNTRKSTLLSLSLLPIICLSSCTTSYPAWQFGVWQNQESVTFETYGVTLNSLRVETVENLDTDYEYDEINRFASDGGEYIPETNFIFYFYVEDVLLTDLSALTYMRQNWYHTVYIYNDKYDLEMQLAFFEDSEATNHFEMKLWLYRYYNNDPYNYDHSSSSRANPSSITLYKV